MSAVDFMVIEIRFDDFGWAYKRILYHRSISCFSDWTRSDGLWGGLWKGFCFLLLWFWLFVLFFFFLARPWTWRPESTAGAGVQRDPIDQFDHGHQPAALPVARVHRPARGAALPHVARLPTLPQVSRCFRFCSFYRTDFVAVPSIASRHNVEPFLTVEGLSFLGDDVLAQFRDRVRFSRALTGEKLVQTCYASKKIQLTKTRK